MTLPHVVVVGGGISGLAAAWFLTQGADGPRARVTILEADDRIGGKLRVREFQGFAVDVGAEAILATRPEAVSLIKDLGLRTVSAASTQASIYSRGKLRTMPTGMLTGVPTDLRKLAASGIVSVPGLLRIPLDRLIPRTVLHGDVSVGDYVSTRLGSEVTARLVEPLLGGVYAGRADDLSLQTTVPALYRAASTRRSALDAATSVLEDGLKTRGPRKGPLFVGLDGGVGNLAQELAAALRRRGVKIVTSTAVTGLSESPTGWTVHAAGRRRQNFQAQAVLFATQASVTGKLLAKVNEPAAAELAGIDYADVVVGTLAYPAPATRHLVGSGFLVPPIEGRAVKGVTYSTSKWHWSARAARTSAADGLMVMRVSMGRAGDDVTPDLPDDELLRLAASDVADMADLPTEPAAAMFTRWRTALPQYSLGHRTRVAEIREWLINTPGLAVCGSAYEGVGIPACIGSAQAAVGTVLQQLAEQRQWAHG